MIDRVSIMTVVAARACLPSGSGQIFTAEVMQELARSQPERFEWNEASGELRKRLCIVVEGGTVFIC